MYEDAIGRAAMTTAVASYRFSTAQQGRSGLGIEAQRAHVRRFATRDRMPSTVARA